jgi:hypothetical protein
VVTDGQHLDRIDPAGAIEQPKSRIGRADIPDQRKNCGGFGCARQCQPPSSPIQGRQLGIAPLSALCARLLDGLVDRLRPKKNAVNQRGYVDARRLGCSTFVFHDGADDDAVASLQTNRPMWTSSGLPRILV